MKILFVARKKNKHEKLVPFIKSQGDSISVAGNNEVLYYPVAGSGIISYLKNSFQIRKYVNENEIDLIHAHYVLSGWSSIFALTGKPIVLSLMGSDAYGIYNGSKVKLSSMYLTLLTFFIQPFVSAIISKSANIDRYVYQRKKANIIPNGVDINKFDNQEISRKEELGLNPDKTHILFLGDPKNLRKNYQLLHESIDKINDSTIEIVAPYPVSHEKVIQYLKSVDVFAMSAFMEGSPNVVKEAMACNCPVVATDVGDVRWLFGDTTGHFIASFDPEDFAGKVKQAILFRKKHGQTKGRERLIELGLDAETVAEQIINVYKKVLTDVNTNV